MNVQVTDEIRELTVTELDEVVGGSILGDACRVAWLTTIGPCVTFTGARETAALGQSCH
jgi:hypothetical protein